MFIVTNILCHLLRILIRLSLSFIYFYLIPGILYGLILLKSLFGHSIVCSLYFRVIRIMSHFFKRIRNSFGIVSIERSDFLSFWGNDFIFLLVIFRYLLG